MEFQTATKNSEEKIMGIYTFMSACLMSLMLFCAKVHHISGQYFMM